MPERLDALWISDIREALAHVEEYTRGMKYSGFLEDRCDVIRDCAKPAETKQVTIRTTRPEWARRMSESPFVR
jgi:hypothetical protein